MKKLRSRTLAFALAIALLCALVPPAAPVFAADGGKDDNIYTVELRYRDEVQITYEHIQGGTVGLDDWWWSDPFPSGVVATRGDIPLGGASTAEGESILQLYCVDAAVPFHSYVGSAGGSTAWVGSLHATVDRVPNYVAVSPEKLPETLKANWNELAWLVLNGFSGKVENAGAGADSAVNDLNTRYSGLSDDLGVVVDGTHPITQDVAVMATKVAIWRFTNPDVVYSDTSFYAKSFKEAHNSKDPDMKPEYTDSGIKQRQFEALVKRLVADAAAHAANPTPSLTGAKMQLSIEQDASIGDVSITTEGRQGPVTTTYRGPYRIRDAANVLNSDDLVFLEATGPEKSGAGGIGFYEKSEENTFTALDFMQKYGDTYSGPGIKKDTDFYVRVPAGLPAGVSLTALARTTTESAVRMPVVLVHQDPATGAQDWQAVQAFIGLALEDVSTTVYGQASLLLSSEEGSIKVYKTAGDATVAGKKFSFKLSYANGAPVRLGSFQLTSSDGDASDQYFGDGKDGIFTLVAGPGSFFSIEDLPTGTYSIEELATDGANFNTSYLIGLDGTARSGKIARVLLDSASLAEVHFTNTPITPVPKNVPPTITLVKHSSGQDSPLLPGAEFTLKRNADSYIARATTNTLGMLSFELPENFGGDYVLEEITAPVHHEPLGSVQFMLINKNGNIEIGLYPIENITGSLSYYENGRNLRLSVANENDSPDTNTLTLVKRSSASGNPPLEGVFFTLDGGGLGKQTASTNAQGVIHFKELPDIDGECEYILTEGTPSANYDPLPGPITIYVEDGIFASAVADWNLDPPAGLGTDDLTLFITNTYTPPQSPPPTPTPPTPSTPSGWVDNPPPPLPEEPEEPEEPEKPEQPTEPDTPAPSSPDTPPGPDYSNIPPGQDPSGTHNLPQTGAIVDSPAAGAAGVLAVLLAAALLAVLLRRRERRM